MKIFTVGFTKKPAATFFNNLKRAGVVRLTDVRLNNTSGWPDSQKKMTFRGIYERCFPDLMKERHMEATLPPATLDGACLLCSEEKPHYRHRRPVAEYPRENRDGVEIRHLP